MASSKLATEVSKTVFPSVTSAPATAPAAIAKPAAKPAKKVVAKPVAVKKAVVAPKAAKVAVANGADVAKEKKIKRVHDSISIPKTEFLGLGEMKTRAGKLGVAVKKTELIRAGIKVLTALTDAAFVAAIRAVPNIKTGRSTKAG
jgi:hypothetical protein